MSEIAGICATCHSSGIYISAIESTKIKRAGEEEIITKTVGFCTEACYEDYPRWTSLSEERRHLRKCVNRGRNRCQVRVNRRGFNDYNKGKYCMLLSRHELFECFKLS